MRCSPNLYIYFLLLGQAYAVISQDTLKYASLNGRTDCVIINKTRKNTYSEYFLQQLSICKEASEYILNDSIMVLDQKDTINIPSFPLEKAAEYVSANQCHHQRNYSLSFSKISIDSYQCQLDILTDYRIKSQMSFTVTLQPSILIRNSNTIYKGRNSNLKITVQATNTIILENLFIENQPCPRTIMFVK